jgi:RNA polymerase sigma-70 factor (ECF subfamily)
MTEGRMSVINPELLARLFDRHAPALVLYARQWCETPEDVVQDAFVKLARLRTQPERTIPWLFRVVRNAAINAGRNDRNRRKLEVRWLGKETWFASDDERIDAQHATRLLAELELEIREVIIARFWGELKFEDIASIQGCSVATAHRRYVRGLTLLYERLEGKWIRQDSTHETT